MEYLKDLMSRIYTYFIVISELNNYNTNSGYDHLVVTSSRFVGRCWCFEVILPPSSGLECVG
jgi:hypothetical protein